MSLSFLLWFSITSILVVFWFWTIFAVCKQKKGWKFYAQKKKLRYVSNGALETPTLTGVLDDYKIRIFASEHSELDARSNRRLTAIEISLHSEMSLSAAVASGGMVPIIETIELNQEYKPAHKDWDDTYVVRAENSAAMQEYFNEARLDKILDLMKVNKAWIALLFLDGQGLLRLDTPLPIDQPKEMDKLIQKMLDTAKVLELAKGEDAKINRKRKASKSTGPVLNVDDDILNDDIGLELDD